MNWKVRFAREWLWLVGCAIVMALLLSGLKALEIRSEDVRMRVPDATFMMRAPTGEEQSVAADQVDFYKSRGAVVLHGITQEQDVPANQVEAYLQKGASIVGRRHLDPYYVGESIGTGALLALPLYLLVGVGRLTRWAVQKVKHTNAARGVY